MKKIKIQAKLSLNKETLANLTKASANKIYGGRKNALFNASAPRGSDHQTICFCEDDDPVDDGGSCMGKL